MKILFFQWALDLIRLPKLGFVTPFLNDLLRNLSSETLTYFAICQY